MYRPFSVFAGLLGRFYRGERFEFGTVFDELENSFTAHIYSFTSSLFFLLLGFLCMVCVRVDSAMSTLSGKKPCYQKNYRYIQLVTILA